MPDTYGLLAEFEKPDALLAGARRARQEGYSRLDAFAPYPVEGLAEAIGFYPKLLPFTVLGGGIAGCVGGFALQYWVSCVAYPLNIGGRPFNTWPAFVPVTFECTILLAALSAVFGMLLYNGLPMPHHALFNVPEFGRASQDRFFLIVRSDDAKFDAEVTRTFLRGLQASEVYDVPR